MRASGAYAWDSAGLNGLSCYYLIIRESWKAPGGTLVAAWITLDAWAGKRACWAKGRNIVCPAGRAVSLSRAGRDRLASDPAPAAHAAVMQVTPWCAAPLLQEDMSESSGPEGSAQGGAGWGEETGPQRERRYATRQATAAKRRTSYNPALDMDKVSHPLLVAFIGRCGCMLRLLATVQTGSVHCWPA